MSCPSEYRTHDLFVMNEVFYQLNYRALVAVVGFEPQFRSMSPAWYHFTTTAKSYQKMTTTRATMSRIPTTVQTRLCIFYLLVISTILVDKVTRTGIEPAMATEWKSVLQPPVDTAPCWYWSNIPHDGPVHKLKSYLPLRARFHAHFALSFRETVEPLVGWYPTGRVLSTDFL